MALPLIHHPAYDAASVSDDHRFPMRKYSLVADKLRRKGAMLIAPELAAPEQLELIHDPAYVRSVLECSLDARQARTIGFQMTPAIAKRSCAAVGGTLYAARFALQAGAAVNLAGGSHHAKAETGAGFCVFNDVAVAAEALIRQGEIARVLVIDLDVHQGDGTALIFANREDVFTLSVHCENNWPTTKPPSDMDVGLPVGTPDAVYLTTLRQVLAKAFAQSIPDFVFYNAGVDPHESDRLGKLALTDSGLAARDQIVAEMCKRHSVPVCGVLGGGYSRDADAVAERHLFLVDALEGALRA